MKKLLSLFFIICMLPLLGGCGSIRSNYREVEQILAIQTMGVDYLADGVRLTLAAPSTARSEDSPVYLTGSGESVSTAIQRIRNYSSEEDLFCAHVNHAVLGEDAAKQGVGLFFSYLCRSPDMRIDTPLYVVRDCSAEELISGVIDGGTGICEVLQAVKTNAEDRGDSTIFTAAEAMGSLYRYGSALLCALDYCPSDETEGSSPSGGGDSGPSSPPGEGGGASGGGGGASGSPKGPPMTAAVDGYAVLKDGRLCAYVSREDSVGANLLLDLPGISELVVRDREGEAVTLELTEGSSSFTPLWGDDGTLEGIHIVTDVTASLLEAPAEETGTDRSEYEDYITARLESAVLQRLRSVLGLSQKLDADFLGLAGRVELADPVQYRNMGRTFPELLPELELRVSVRGRLSHTNNLKDA